MILDIKGSVTGFWAERIREDIEGLVRNGKVDRVMLNLRNVTNVDSLGVRALFSSMATEKEIGVLRGSRCVMDIVSHFYDVRKLKVFDSEFDVVSNLGTALLDQTQGADRRTHPRLPTALPLEFYRVGDEESICFRAVITNLSLGGLFAEYIDLKHAEESLIRLSPYDLKVLHLRIMLPKGRMIEAEGRVVHRRLDGDQLGVGIEFCRIGVDEQSEIDVFLRTQAGFIDS